VCEDKQSLDFEKHSIFHCNILVSGHNRWKQLNNPIFESKSGKTKVAGYQEIHIDWSVWYWGGLYWRLSFYRQ